MKVLFTPIGTYGDIAPMVTYAEYLKEAGHQVHFFSTIDWKDFVVKSGIDFTGFNYNFKDMVKKDSEYMGRPIKGLKHFMTSVNAINELQCDALKAIINDYDLILGAGLQFMAFNYAEYYNKPYYHFFHSPSILKSAHHSPPHLPFQISNKSLNRVLWKINELTNSMTLNKPIMKLRAELNLPKVTDLLTYLSEKSFISASPHIAPVPDDCTFTKQIPYLYYNDRRVLDEKIVKFIDDNEKVVYIGFGSMPAMYSTSELQMFIDAAQSSGFAVIISSGWADYSGQFDSKRILFIKDCPHDKLFEKMAVVIHHGGAGTVHSAAKAGVPQIVIPHILDQYYWTNRLVQIGVSPGMIHYKKLDRTMIKEILTKAYNNPVYKSKAQNLAQKIQKENPFNELNSMVFNK